MRKFALLVVIVMLVGLMYPLAAVADTTPTPDATRAKKEQAEPTF